MHRHFLPPAITYYCSYCAVLPGEGSDRRPIFVVQNGLIADWRSMRTYKYTVARARATYCPRALTPAHSFISSPGETMIVYVKWQGGADAGSVDLEGEERAPTLS